ncbi:MAG: hypothetical protein HYT73_01825, partial [Candidatus Aenigmarchaeota archaeon]|nr:hypothetical protein [Candidatus Aenigmarchaeota archaeon]
MPKKLNEEQVSKIRKEFYHYKTDRNLTTKHIGKKLGICSKTVSLYFRNLFGVEYKKLAKRKSAWSTKVDENQV